MSTFVVAADEAGSASREDDTAATRVTFDPSSGSELLEQRVVRFAPGRSRPRTSGSREELLFVLAGTGTLVLEDEEHALEPETGVYVAPGESYVIDNPGPDELRVVSVLALEPDRDPEAPRRVTVRLAEREAHRAGKDREFRTVVDSDSGCRTVTQFVGVIPPGRALPHYHLYDEVAYILEGQGILHIEGEETPVAAGSCIHFPARVVHILENVGSGPLRVLGVFHPAGSPAEAYNV